MIDQIKSARSIFVEMVEKVPHEKWAEFLDQACGEDDELRTEVQRLLKAHEEIGTFMDRPAAEPFTIDSPIAEGPGTVIGPYKLLQQIGEGGFGVVFMAEQTEPIHRTVALKIIKPGMDTRQVIARFEAERQALAMMDHPNIARVIDGGTTETRRPYFVMDLVKGIPITDYCDQQHFSVRQRLGLMTQVCHAVQHAHQKGIIHRDLKPSNVLVAEYDGKPVPKIIDFGVAKATARKLTERTMFTEFGQVIGTVEYMSPEQARFNQLDVDTRSDIYSLGVLLYELLVGSTPLDRRRLQTVPFDETLRMIREDEPLKPSTKLGLSEMLPAIAANRHTEPARLNKEVRGELDWIVMKCLEKDRNRRYETASALARDIERYLYDEPVQACPPSVAYRLKKFVRRNKVAVLGGLAIAATLIVGLTISSIGFIEARQQTKIAQTEAVRSEQVARFLKEMLAAAGPSVARGRDATMLREILDKTAERVEKDLPNQPEVQGDLWFTLGQTYADVGENERATGTFQHAAESYRRALGEESTKLALALGHLGRCQSRIGYIANGKANAQMGLQIARKIGDPETLATCLFNVGLSFDHSMLVSPEGEPFLRESVAIRRKLGNDPGTLAKSLSALGAALKSNDSAEAERLTREALSLHRHQLGPEHPDVANDMYILGQLLIDHQQFGDAEAVLREAVALSRKILDQNDPKQYVTLSMLLNALRLQGKWGEVQTLARQAVDSYPSSAGYRGVLGSVLAYQGDWQAAAEQFSRAIELNPNYSVVVGRQALTLLKLQRIAQFERFRHDYLFREFNRDAYGSEHMLFEVSAFLLMPTDGGELEQLCRLGELAAVPTALSRNEYSTDVIKAQTAYRRGNYKAARELTNRVVSRKDDTWAQRKAQAWFLHAMACAQLSEFESARTAFAEGSKIINQPSRDALESWPWRWPGWIIAELLGKQAAQLLGITESQTQVDPERVTAKPLNRIDTTVGPLPTTNAKP